MSTLRQGLQHLYDRYPSVAKKDIQEIMAFTLHQKREELFLHLEQSLGVDSLHQIETLVQEREAHCPLAYLLGYVDFYDCKIFVNPHVIVPRVETEMLLDLVLKETRSRNIHVVFDVCTGSGCLGVAFKKRHGPCALYLSDISQPALDTARKNALENQVEATFLLGDLMQPFQDKADLVLCNPPYIADSEFEGLEPSVKNFEPRGALTSGSSGLEIFQKLSDQLPAYMNSGALLAMEIGCTQKESVSQIFSKHPWKHFRCVQDYAGLDRFIFLELE